MLAASAALAGAALFVYSGVYDISATEQHTAPVYWLIMANMRQSVRHHAREISVPTLESGALIRRGRLLFDEHCVQCHGGPGVAPRPFALGLTPNAPNLARTGREWPERELYWTIKHGIKMSAMPAWEFRLVDDDLWALVAYVRTLADESPATYRASTPNVPSLAARQSLSTDRAGDDIDRARKAFQQYACTTCHEIPGVVGGPAPVGPPLSAMTTRSHIAGVVANSPENMVRWLRAPQALHPGSAMPNLGVTERDARAMATYLYTAK
jgi:mono/diheme cytochrome c family protein